MPVKQPKAARPWMPGYGISPSEDGLLPWAWAQSRLIRCRNYWLATTRPDSRPHVMAVWGVWLEERFWFSTAGISRKARNLDVDARCVVTTEGASEAVILEGTAIPITDGDALGRLRKVYVEKYGSGFPEGSAVFAVDVCRAFGFIESEDRFQSAATRWAFEEP
jgi:hypothetical protein